MITVNNRPIWETLLEQEGSLSVEDADTSILEDMAQDTLKQLEELTDEQLEDKWTD